MRINVASQSGWTIFHFASRSPPMLHVILDILGQAKSIHLGLARHSRPPSPDVSSDSDSENESKSS